MTISSEFTKGYEEIKSNLKSLYNGVTMGLKGGSAILEAEKSFKGLIESEIKGENVLGVESSTSDVSCLSEFIAKVVFTAYFNGFDNDKVTSQDSKFGFAGLQDKLSSCISVAKQSSNGANWGIVDSNLLACLREEHLESYLANKSYEKDLELVKFLCKEVEDTLDTDLVKLMLEDIGINSLYVNTLENILAVYKHTLQDGFGLKPSYGVLSSNSTSAGFIVGRDNKLAYNEAANNVLADVYSNLCGNYMNIKVSKLRQFDYKEVLKSDLPVYFPKKILEIAMGRCTTQNINKDIYKQYENVNSYEEYETGYVKPMMEQELKKIISELLASNKWTTSSEIAENSTREYIKGVLDKITRSYCCILLISSFNFLNNKVNSLAIRVVNVGDNLNANITRELFSSLVTNNRIEYNPALNISAGKFVTGNVPLPYDIFEYKHDFDEALTQAEPLFGYKAVELFARRNIPITWDNMLLGENTAGTPLFTGIDSGSIPLKRTVVHNMMAGSRSGKGVMTMNMLACGMASDKAIFYIDRKPDMAVMFAELSKGNMFLVNGGQYESPNDPDNLWTEKGNLLRGWDNPSNMPNYLESAFVSGIKTYKGSIGDFVYWRAMMLCLSIIVARVTYADNTEIYGKLGGDSGAIFVFDEFKNWQENFESKFFSVQGIFCNENRISKSDINEYEKLLLDIKKAKAKLQGDTKPDTKVSTEADIKSKTERVEKLITPFKVYCTQLMNKYEDSIKICSEKQSAGFYGDANEEANKVDIFLIGQHIKIDGKDGLYEKRDSALYNVNEFNKGKSLFRGLMDSFKHDWFMGFNHDGDEERRYMGANVNNSMSNEWISRKRYWGYCANAPIADVRTKAPEDTVYFKPYLVLNNHYESDPNSSNSEAKYKFVTGCRNRVNDQVAGMWDSVRLKHVQNPEVQEKNPQYGTLNEGIGFAGLVKCIFSTSSNASQLNCATALSKSKNIADYVAGCMGYSRFQDLLYDFSPKGMFSIQDVINAIADPSSYASNLSSRLPLFERYGFLSDKAEESLNSFEDTDEEDIVPESINASDELDDEENTQQDDFEYDFDDFDTQESKEDKLRRQIKSMIETVLKRNPQLKAFWTENRQAEFVERVVATCIREGL